MSTPWARWKPNMLSRMSASSLQSSVSTSIILLPSFFRLGQALKLRAWACASVIPVHLRFIQSVRKVMGGWCWQGRPISGTSLLTGTLAFCWSGAGRRRPCRTPEPEDQPFSDRSQFKFCAASCALSTSSAFSVGISRLPQRF